MRGKSKGTLGVQPPSGKAPPEPCNGVGSNPSLKPKKRRDTKWCLFFFLAEDEGFEPPQTESESGVLPLHKSSMALFRLPRHKQHGYYSTEKENVKHYFPFLKEFFLLRQYPLWEKKICTQKERK